MKTISKELRLRVYKKCNNHCGYCGKELLLKEMQVDHITPQSDKIFNKHMLFEGEETQDKNDFNNLMPTCRRCNHYKRAANLEQFRRIMVTLHERIQRNYINKVGVDFGIITITPFDGIFYFEKKIN